MKRFVTYSGKGVFGIFAITVMFLISACTAGKQSARKLAEAENALQDIRQVEARDYAQAEFNEAQAKLEYARELEEKGKHKKAALKADEAMAAAELAEVKTLSQKADESLRDLKASIQSLKDKLEKYRESGE